MLNFHTHRPLSDETATRSLGLHPWHLQAETLAADLRQLEHRLRVGSFQMIGECGLDKCCTTPFPLQQKAFLRQLLLAERLRMPVVVHCVHAFNELLALRTATPRSVEECKKTMAEKEKGSAPGETATEQQEEKVSAKRTKDTAYTPWQQPWVVHGFTGSSQLALQLLRAGIFVSFGAALLDSRRVKVREALLSLGGARTEGEKILCAPQEQPLSTSQERDIFLEREMPHPAPCIHFFLETDDSPCRIQEIYACAAALLHCRVEALTCAADHLFLSLLSHGEPEEEKPTDPSIISTDPTY